MRARARVCMCMCVCVCVCAQIKKNIYTRLYYIGSFRTLRRNFVSFCKLSQSCNISVGAYECYRRLVVVPQSVFFLTGLHTNILLDIFHYLNYGTYTRGTLVV
jgi:hypothetical protein